MEEIVAACVLQVVVPIPWSMFTKVPPLTSDQQLTQLVENTAVELVGRENVLYRPAPTMGVEDFSWYTQGIIMRVCSTLAPEMSKKELLRGGIIQSLILMKNVSGLLCQCLFCFQNG